MAARATPHSSFTHPISVPHIVMITADMSVGNTSEATKVIYSCENAFTTTSGLISANRAWFLPRARHLETRENPHTLLPYSYSESVNIHILCLPHIHTLFITQYFVV